MAGLLAAVVTGVLIGMEAVVRREILGRLEADLDNTAAAVDSNLRGTLARLAAEARVVAEEPRLKAVASAPGIDRATRDDVARELKEAIGWDLLGLGDPDGGILTLIGAPGEAGAPVVLAAALESRPAQSYRLEGGRLYQTVAVHIAFGEQIVGTLLAGVELSDRRVEELHMATHAGVAFFDRHRLIASSVTSESQREALAGLARTGLPREVRLDEEEFLTREVRLGDGEVWAAVLQSKQSAFGPYLRLRRAVLAIGAAALLVAIGLAAIMAQGIANPVARLVALASAVRDGKLDARVEPCGGKELSDLGTTLNEMVSEVARQRRRDELAGFLVHDLKNPLTSVLVYARMLAGDETLSSNAREDAASVVSAAEATLGMVVDLLDVGRSADGRLVPNAAELNLPELVEEVRKGAAGRAAAKRQQLVVASNGAKRVRADRELLRRVLDNLLDNSLKYTPAGGDIVVEWSSPEPGTVELRVRDEGPGIPAALRERIFDKYFRLDPEASPHGRTSRGLGLVFCRAAVEAHGGRIWVEENAPRGTAFCVRLPEGGATR